MNQIYVMSKTAGTDTVECLNPNTGGRMNIDKKIYEQISKAICQTLKKGKALTYSEIVDGINDHFKETKVSFPRSVGWYAVTVKNDMEARGIISVVTEKGRKLNRLAK